MPSTAPLAPDADAVDSPEYETAPTCLCKRTVWWRDLIVRYADAETSGEIAQQRPSAMGRIRYLRDLTAMTPGAAKKGICFCQILPLAALSCP